MSGDYQFGKRAPACSACGHAFAAGEEYRSALLLEAGPQRPPSAGPEPQAPAPAEAAPAPAPVPAPAPGAAAAAPDQAPHRPESAAQAPAGPDGGLPLRRLDICARCWDEQRAAEYFSCWKSVVPAEETGEPQPLARRIDAETIYGLFRRLEGHADPVQQKFRFILALMLMRKKRLRFTGVVRSPHGEHLVLDDRDEGVTHKVLDPGLAEEEIDGMRSQVDRLLGGAEEPDAPEAPPAGAAPPGPDAGRPPR